MILKYISLTELNFSKSWLEGLIKIKSLSHFNKYMTIFWLLGPFIYLIERDPADLWLSLISIVFIIRCFKNKDWYWTTQLWFKSALTLWLLGLISALTSPDPFYTFQQGLVWIRFPLYAAAAQVWIAKDRDIRVVMLLSTLEITSLADLLGRACMSRALLVSQAPIQVVLLITFIVSQIDHSMRI